MTKPNSALKQYRTVRNHSAVAEASPHQLITMLFTGILDNLAAAKGGIKQDNIALKGEKISRAIEIVDNLRAVLDMSQGGDVAINLRDLYDYMEARLLKANIDSDPAIIDEVAGLVREIKLGWDGIPAEQRSPARPGNSSTDHAGQP